MNTPYVKEGGIKITKNKPYLSMYPNRRTRRGLGQKRKFSNKKGIQLVVTKFFGYNFGKVEKQFQRFKGKTVVQYKVK